MPAGQDKTSLPASLPASQPASKPASRPQVSPPPLHTAPVETLLRGAPAHQHGQLAPDLRVKQQRPGARERGDREAVGGVRVWV